jgi:16S rRNA (guanine966-N2)-methyltransferase
MNRAVDKRTAPHAALPNRLRIIGGRWRGRKIAFPPLAAIRPSPDRVRETLFNWLQAHVAGARCLDLFAGSGALGIEALSRGAAHVTFVDLAPQVGRHLTQTLQQLGCDTASFDMARVVVADALRFLKGTPQPFDIVFLDPPFASDLLAQVCAELARGWLAPTGYVYVESPAAAGLPALPPGWNVHRTKRAGQVGYHLLQTTPSPQAIREVLP